MTKTPAALERRVRRVVATHLGVETSDLVPEVSLADELAIDSLDLVELGVALEDQLGVSVPEGALERARTYGDLVRLAVAATRARRPAHLHPEGEPLLLRARILPPRGRVGAILERSEPLTPYGAETIADDALRAGPGARLEIAMPARSSTAARADVQATFAWLRPRGVRVRVRREGDRAAEATGSGCAA